MITSYQLKVIEKNTKPIIWRRIDVPAGITFSTLSVILNYLLGFDGPADYEFEFFRRKLQLRERIENALFNPTYDYDLQSAQDTFIDDYLSSENWFSYCYQSVSAFRIEIEKVISGKSLIFLFYTKCSKAVSEADPDGEESGRRMQFLFDNCRINYTDKTQYLTQAEIYRNISDGIGLYGMKNPQSREGNLKTCATNHLKEFTDVLTAKILNSQIKRDELPATIEDSLEQLQQSVRDTYLFDAFKTPDGNTLREILIQCYDKKSLIQIAKDLGLKKPSALSLGDLSSRISQELLRPDRMKRFLICFSDTVISAFEKALKQADSYEPSSGFEVLDLENFEALDYLFWHDNDSNCEIPMDVKEAYYNISTPDFHKERQAFVWLAACLNIVQFYYVSIPLKEFCHLYRKNGQGTDKEIITMIKEHPDQINPCVIADDMLVAKPALKDNLYRKILKVQESKSFYFPEKQEIMDLWDYRFPRHQKEYCRLKNFLTSKCGLDEAEAIKLCQQIWNEINTGAHPTDVFNLIGQKIIFDSKDTLASFAPLVMQANNTTRMYVHRGHTPLEISAGNKSRPGTGKLPVIMAGSSTMAELLEENRAKIEKMGLSLDLDSNAADTSRAVISPNGTVQKISGKKIYPNDPCPCGSGKKFKKCCGK